MPAANASQPRAAKTDSLTPNGCFGPWSAELRRSLKLFPGTIAFRTSTESGREERCPKWRRQCSLPGTPVTVARLQTVVYSQREALVGNGCRFFNDSSRVGEGTRWLRRLCIII